MTGTDAPVVVREKKIQIFNHFIAEFRIHGGKLVLGVE